MMDSVALCLSGGKAQDRYLVNPVNPVGKALEVLLDRIHRIIRIIPFFITFWMKVMNLNQPSTEGSLTLNLSSQSC